MSGRGSGGTARRGRPVATRGHGASLPVRALWFLFVGWWLAGLWLSVSWFLLVTVVGAPVGIKLLNGLPKVVSLKERTLLPPTAAGGVRRPQQPPLLKRAIYFLLVGWWLSGVWAAVAYALTLSVIGIPFGIWMYSRLPFVVSLYRY